VLKRKGVSFASDPNHSQVSSTYDNAYGYEEGGEDGHCDGPTLRASQAPPEIKKLQQVLTAYIRQMRPDYSKRVVNYLSIQRYEDHTVGIDWHNHNEDFGVDAPLFIISTGAARPFHLGLINRTRPKEPRVGERWSKMAEHGSLIAIPSDFNYTHWHAILPEKYPCGVRISVNTKCLIAPKVFSILRRHPRGAVYVGCKYGQFEGTVYGNDHRPFEGHKHPIARNEAKFRGYVNNRMQDPAFGERAIKDLRGKHLLCWCIQDGPERAPFCHARVWLEVVNR
jgi:alkylated DNA repair dioxygenase AlkB